MELTVSSDKQWAMTGPDTWIRLDKLREITLGDYAGRCEVRATFETGAGEVVLGEYDDVASAVQDVNRQLDIRGRDQNRST